MKLFSRFPVFRVVIPFSIGIICTASGSVSLLTTSACAITGLFLSALFTSRNYASGKYAQRWLAGIPFYCCFFGLGGTLTWFHQSINYNEHFQSVVATGSYVGEVVTESQQTGKGCRFITEVIAVKSGKGWKPSRGKLLLYFDDSLHEYKAIPGSKIIFRCDVKTIKGPDNPDVFNAQRYYTGKGVWHQGYVVKNALVVLNSPVKTTAFTYARILRDDMLLKLKKHLGEEHLGVAGALLLGYEDWLDPELEAYWSGAGVLHVLCVSGMHVMLIYVILAGLLSWMEKKSLLRHLRYVLLLALIWFYAMVTGFSPSVIRAASMISFVIFGNWINRDASIYNLLCSSCILMFMIDPYLVLSAGFQLSFLAVCGIIFLHKLVMPLWVAPNKLLHKTWELISVSLAAQLATFPLSLFLFHQFPNYFLIANLLIIPLSTIVMYSGLLLLVTDWIPYAGLITGTVTSYGIRLLNELVIFIGQLPGAMSENIFLSLWETILIYLILIFVPVWLVYKSRTWLFINLVLITALGSFRMYYYLQASSNHQFTVYNAKGKTIISLFNGRTAILFTDSVNEKTLRYATREHIINNMILSTETRSVRQGEAIKITGKSKPTIVILKDWKKNQHLSSDFPHGVHCLVLGGNFTVDASAIIDSFRPSLVIFDSSCRQYQVARLQSELQKSGVGTYSVKENGAFQYALKNID